MDTKRFLIVGNGAAGATAAEVIRQNDPWASITMISAEPYPMYSRPGLAYVLMREIPYKQIFARRPEWYEQMRIDLVMGEAIGVDTARRQVVLADGRFLPYDKLLIATGARATTAPYPGGDLDGVVYLDTLDGTRDLMKKAKRAKRAVVIGGGITALEMTEGLSHLGIETHYFVRRDRLWGKVFNEEEAAILDERMREHGVIIHYKTEIEEIVGGRKNKVAGVKIKGTGELFKCDLVGMAIGVKPVIDVVKGSSIKTDRAILVNEYLQTSAPDVYAAGDCAQVYDRWTDSYMLDILWPSAVAEARIAALNMLGEKRPYVKGSPFNACLLFGLHITTIGQVNPRIDDEGAAVLQHLSRGSSEVWYTYPRHYHSAWSSEGPNTIRMILDGDRLVGALIMGEQSPADPLRYIIENNIDISSWKDDLAAGGERLRRRLAQFWYQQSQSVQVAS